MKNTMIGLTFLLMSIFLLSAFAVAEEAEQGIQITELRIDDMEMDLDEDTVYAERGNDLDVTVTLKNYDSVEVEDATMKIYFWYEDADEEGIEDVKEVDLRPNHKKDFDVSLRLPKDLDLEEPELTLFVQVYDGSGDLLNEQISLTVVSEDEHMVEIKDIMLHPESRVMAGDLLTAQVRLENIGEPGTVEDDVKVIARVLGLEGAMDSTYLLKDLEFDDDQSTEPLSFEIPPCAKGGEYELEVEVLFDGDNGRETSKRTITVVESDSDRCQVEAKTQVSAVNIISGMQVLSDSQRTATFPVVISNSAETSKAFVISAEALGDWASEVKAQETSVVVQAGNTKTVLVLATAKDDAQVGKQLVSIKVKDSEGNMVKEEAAELNIAGSTETKVSYKRVLEYGLVALVVLLVILGLIIGFNKLREDEEDLEEEDKSYY
tara:strand:- start:5031 stop:6332 length:1302 start_codon:yes stop_codon:yes gene_type:complete